MEWTPRALVDRAQRFLPVVPAVADVLVAVVEHRLQCRVAEPMRKTRKKTRKSMQTLTFPTRTRKIWDMTRKGMKTKRKKRS
jgi:hypothetical protein